MKPIRKYFTLITALASLLTGMSGCKDPSDTTDVASEETMFQVSTLQSLMAGNYDGFIPVSELRRHGDIGLGTFDRIDGEMIVLDGTVFQARYDGSVQTADDKTGVPFATVTFFDSDIQQVIEKADSLEELTERLTETVVANDSNIIYITRIDVKDCAKVLVRSALPQEKPYRPLAQVLTTDQREFSYSNISGTIVAVYFPAFFDRQNTPGWHCHFISDDRTRGGHLLDFASSTPFEVHFDITPYFNMYMPSDDAFASSDLSSEMSSEMSSEIEEVE